MPGGGAFGDVGEIRSTVRAWGLNYAVDVKSHTRVRIVGYDGSVSDTMSVQIAAQVLGAREHHELAWRQGTREELSYRFACICVKAVTHKGLVRRIKQRWRIERSYRGWQHHVTCVLSCAAFIIAEKARAFSPSSRRAQSDSAIGVAA